MVPDSKLLIVFLFLAAFILLILSTITAPLNKSFYLLKFDLYDSGATKPTGRLEFGALGYCILTYSSTFLDTFVTPQQTQCSPSTLGYKFDSTLLALPNFSNAANVIPKNLTYALILHPIALALSILALLSFLAVYVRPGRTWYMSAMAFGWSATAVAFSAFIVDYVLFQTAKGRIKKDTGNKQGVDVGNAVWFTMVAWIALLAASVGTVGRSRERAGPPIPKNGIY